MNRCNKWVIDGIAASRNLWTLRIWPPRWGGAGTLQPCMSPHEVKLDELAIILLEETVGVRNEVPILIGLNLSVCEKLWRASDGGGIWSLGALGSDIELNGGLALTWGIGAWGDRTGRCWRACDPEADISDSGNLATTGPLEEEGSTLGSARAGDAKILGAWVPFLIDKRFAAIRWAREGPDLAALRGQGMGFFSRKWLSASYKEQLSTHWCSTMEINGAFTRPASSEFSSLERCQWEGYHLARTNDTYLFRCTAPAFPERGVNE